MADVHYPLFNGVKTVAAAVTPERLDAGPKPFAWLTIYNPNAGDILVGTASATIVAAGIPVVSGESFTFPSEPNNYADLRDVWVKVAVDGNTVRYFGGTK